MEQLDIEERIIFLEEIAYELRCKKFFKKMSKENKYSCIGFLCSAIEKYSDMCIKKLSKEYKKKFKEEINIKMIERY